MAIPKHDQIRIPALELLNKHGDLKLKDFVELLAAWFQLTDEELVMKYPSGNGHIFYDRVTWALSYLNMASLVEKPKRGYYRLSKEGTKILQTPEKINAYVDSIVTGRESQKSKTNKDVEIKEDETALDATPAEKLYSSFEKIKNARKAEILDTILKKSPYEFENLVVQLLQKMGYGGEIRDSGLVTKSSNDGGIDGIIKEDILGLGRIHIQAKCYAPDNGIGREDVQRFAGALLGAPVSKGVFITTSYFTPGAIQYAQNISSTTIILIDGNQLAEYIYEYGLGLQTVQTIELKKLDTDFWDSMKDKV